jgi:hypothetical protein
MTIDLLVFLRVVFGIAGVVGIMWGLGHLDDGFGTQTKKVAVLTAAIGAVCVGLACALK